MMGEDKEGIKKKSLMIISQDLDHPPPLLVQESRSHENISTTSLLTLSDHHQSLYNVVIPTSSISQVYDHQQQQQEERVVEIFNNNNNPKRPKYGSGGQWKILPSKDQQKNPLVVLEPHTTTTSSSTPTTSSPLSPPCQDQTDTTTFQVRKGKLVSPVWKPNEMLWLARAWRIQYQGLVRRDDDSNDVVSLSNSCGGRGKTRAEKDKEVSEFLNKNGVHRDAKTSGTKWDNMLGEFRKVYDWEKSIPTSSDDQRENVNGKSYFRLSPYERKVHKLPASFDEDVYNELSQFMGIKPAGGGKASSTSNRITVISPAHLYDTGTTSPPPPPLTTSTNIIALPPLPPPPPLLSSFKEEDQLSLSGRIKRGPEGGGSEEMYQHGGRGTTEDVGGPSSSSSRELLRRIGRIRMNWDESVNLWADYEEGENCQRGRVKLQGLSFLNADEITFLDETMAGCTMEAFEEGPLKGFSIDKFVCGQQVKVFGRRKSSNASLGVSSDRLQLSGSQPSNGSIPPWEYQDPTEYYLGCLKVPPTTLPTLFELSRHLQEPPPQDLRFPLRKDVYRDLPQGKELFFTTTTEFLDCRSITFDILSSITRSNPSISSSTATSRDSFITIWDDCINRVVSKFCSLEMVIVRKPSFISSTSSSSTTDTLQDQWPNVTGFVRNLCLWRGEEVDRFREGNIDPSSSIVEKILWSYMDLPYILGYYAVGYSITFCALSRSQDRVIRTDLYSIDLSTPVDRLKSLVPCWRIAGLLPLLAERCFNTDNNKNLFPFSDFERLDLGGGNLIEMTPNTVRRSFSSRRKFIAVKEIYDFLDRRIPHAEYIFRSSEKDLALTFKPRGCKLKPTNCEQLVEALKFVTKALVALHDLSFMHRDLGWDKVMKRSDRENEWFVLGFEEAVGAPQIYPNGGILIRSRHAPEMGRGLHGVKVDVWGVGQLVKTSGLAIPLLLRELQNRCLDMNPEQRPSAADCYHHLLQLQSSLSCVAPSGI